MVHYDPRPINAIPKTPVLCPKCGSHRTEIVGQSGDGVPIIRCNVCGARSQVTITTKPDDSHTELMQVGGRT